VKGYSLLLWLESQMKMLEQEEERRGCDSGMSVVVDL
jgi:hypothetical protein